ncbi:MAG TPA: YdeI/OmpD-associated family protein [Opitutaceae bacterium]|nr:YdeI/OmpD-associated family protein [Opitutaceae bacterium]
MKPDPRIDAYIARARPFAQPILQRLRRLVHEACPDVEEDIKWGMPTFLYRGKILAGMAAFKAHATFGFWHQEMRKLLAKDLDTREQAMGSLGRITAEKDLPADRTLLRYIRAAVKLEDAGAPRQVPVKARPTLPVPDDLAAALKTNRKAAATFDAFPPSHRREYVEWITEAKRPETRARRIDTTLEWLAAGKPRHWKYQKC